MSIREPLSISDMKHIAHEIIEEEEKKWDIKLDIFPFTFIEYYKSDFFRKKLKLCNSIDYVTLPFNAMGVNDNQGSSIIFLGNFHCYKKLEEKLFNIIFACYHEYRHSIQNRFKTNTYDFFLSSVEFFIRRYANYDYYFEHDKYSSEIGANLYAVRCTSEYMEKNYPDLYKKYKVDIERIERGYLRDYMLFDASDLIERVIRIINFNKKMHSNNEIIEKIGNKTKIPFIKKINLCDLPIVLRYFFDSELNFKSIKEILKIAQTYQIEKKVIYHVLSCDSFLKSINMENLSDEELALLNESLKYTCTLYKNQKKYIEKINSSQFQYSSSNNKIAEKIKKISKILENILSIIKNPSRNEIKRQSHISDVLSYLNESEDLINRRK